MWDGPWRRCHRLRTLRWHLLRCKCTLVCICISRESHCNSSIHSCAHTHTEAPLDPHTWMHTIDTYGHSMHVF